METVEIRDVRPTGVGLQPSAEHQICAFSRRYSKRGLVNSVLKEAAQQTENERSTQKLAPDAYRLSSLTDAAIGGCYRHGKEHMEVSDLLFYFRETRQKRIRDLDFSQIVKEETLAVSEKAPQEGEQTTAGLPTVWSRLSGAIRSGRKNLKVSANEWFDSSVPDATKAKKRFPLSAFAAIGAVAVSLMLIVASSVLLTRAESKVNQLNEDILTAYSKASDLEADLETRDNLILIRQIATEEYGMVDEEYIRMQYITLATKDSIETYEEERTKGTELSALLSGIGIR